MKEKRKFKDTIFCTLLLAELIMQCCAGVGLLIIEAIEIMYGEITSPLYVIVSTYLITFAPIVVGFLVIAKNNEYLFKTLKFDKRKLIIGLCVGFLSNLACAMVAYLNKDISFTANKVNVLILIISLFCVFIQSGAEELIYRGFIYERINKNYNSFKLAIIFNSVWFGLGHILNPGATILSTVTIMVIGLFLSLTVYYSKSLWPAIGIHTAWNFTQNFLLGLPNSGMVSPYSVFSLASQRNSFAYNINFGIESTIVALIVNLLLCLVIYLLYKNKKNIKQETKKNDK